MIKKNNMNIFYRGGGGRNWILPLLFLMNNFLFAEDKSVIISDSRADKIGITGQKIEISTISVFQVISSVTIQFGDGTTMNTAATSFTLGNTVVSTNIVDSSIQGNDIAAGVLFSSHVRGNQFASSTSTLIVSNTNYIELSGSTQTKTGGIDLSGRITSSSATIGNISVFSNTIEVSTINMNASRPMIQLQDNSSGGTTFRIKNGVSGNGFLTISDNDDVRVIFRNDGTVAIGANNPTNRFEIQNGTSTVRNGNYYVDNSTFGYILRSPDTSCWQIQVSNTGALSARSKTCP